MNETVVSSGAEDLNPLEEFERCSAVARKITTLSCCVIPAVLQTPEVIEASPAPQVFKDKRRAKQERALAGDAEIELLLNETVLYRRMGRLSIWAMRKQLARLKEVIYQYPQVSVGVIPLDAPYTPADEIAGLSMAYSQSGTPLGLYEERWNILGDDRDRFISDPQQLLHCEEQTFAPVRENAEMNTAAVPRIDRAIAFLRA